MVTKQACGRDAPLLQCGCPTHRTVVIHPWGGCAHRMEMSLPWGSDIHRAVVSCPWGSGVHRVGMSHPWGSGVHRVGMSQPQGTSHGLCSLKLSPAPWYICSSTPEPRG